MYLVTSIIEINTFVYCLVIYPCFYKINEMTDIILCYTAVYSSFGILHTDNINIFYLKKKIQ